MLGKQFTYLLGKSFTRNGSALVAGRRTALAGAGMIAATNVLIYQQMFTNMHILKASTGGDNGGSSGGGSGSNGGGSQGPSSSQAGSADNKKEEKVKVN